MKGKFNASDVDEECVLGVSSSAQYFGAWLMAAPLRRENYYIHMGVYYHHLEAVAVKRAYFGSFEFHPIHLDNVQCTGSEENITQCSYVTSTAINCDHSEDAGVICGGEYIQEFFKI